MSNENRKHKKKRLNEFDFMYVCEKPILCEKYSVLISLEYCVFFGKNRWNMSLYQFNDFILQIKQKKTIYVLIM